MLPKDLVLESIELKSEQTLSLYHKECRVSVQVPALNGHQASKQVVTALSAESIGEVKRSVLNSQFEGVLRDQDYQLVLKGVRVLDDAKVGEFDGSHFHLTRASDTAILLHIQSEDGSYFDARVRPSAITILERESSFFVCARRR